MVPLQFRLYFNIMDSVTRKHLKMWLADAAANPTEKPIMMTTRDLNMETSLRVFCGDHLPDQATREISDKYWAITNALELVNFPLALPGTKIYRAIQARKVTFYWLELAAKRSKEAMSQGKEPQCMLDEWVTLLNDPAFKGRKEFSDREMAMVVFSFLFASQDAMSSGVIYGFQHLADHPDVLAKVREEQSRVRSGRHDKPMTLEDLERMPYLKAVVKESLRVKPPVTMVRYLSILYVRSILDVACRCLIWQPSHSLFRIVTPCPLVAWLFHPSTTRCMTPRFSLNPIP
jgi:sterol 22-desaturase